MLLSTYTGYSLVQKAKCGKIKLIRPQDEHWAHAYTHTHNLQREWIKNMNDESTLYRCAGVCVYVEAKIIARLSVHFCLYGFVCDTPVTATFVYKWTSKNRNKNRINLFEAIFIVLSMLLLLSCTHGNSTLSDDERRTTTIKTKTKP